MTWQELAGKRPRIFVWVQNPTNTDWTKGILINAFPPLHACPAIALIEFSDGIEPCDPKYISCDPPQQGQLSLL